MNNKCNYFLIFLFLLYAQIGTSQNNDSISNGSGIDNKWGNDSIITSYIVINSTDTLFHYESFSHGKSTGSEYYENMNKRDTLKSQPSTSGRLSEEKINNANLSATLNINQSKSVGQIPFEEGATPTGGRTYLVPVLTASGNASAPQVNITYNSQSGNGIAGYGWSASGYSAITVTPKNLYYDGTSAAVNLSDPASFSYTLDGVRLVANNSIVTEYHYETAQGYTLVKKNLNASGQTVNFNVLFPNGSSAVYGFTNNSTVKHIYPVTSITDMKGYRIDFEYVESGNSYYISKIKYGGKSISSHTAEIVFEYVSRTDYTTTYFSGLAIESNLLLKKITSYNDGVELRTYTLTHNYVDEVNRLVQIDCSTENSSLNPLTFNYDMYYPEENGMMTVDPYGAILTRYFPDNPSYVAGKFINNDFNDGLITFPKISTYGLTGTKKVWRWFQYYYHYQFGSLYQPDQKFLIAPKLDFLSNMTEITAESGFQAINAVDVNGDGVDEIVKINFNGHTGTKSILKITVYTAADGTSLHTRSFNVNVEGIVTDDDLISPISRSYYFGDFLGTGKSQLLTVSHNKTFLNESRSSCFNIIDLENGTTINAPSLFSHGIDEIVEAIDINGDGRTEICHMDNYSYKVYAFNNSGTLFTLKYRLFDIQKQKCIVCRLERRQHDRYADTSG